MENPEAWGDAQMWGWGVLLSVILLFPPNPRTPPSLSQPALSLLQNSFSSPWLLHSVFLSFFLFPWTFSLFFLLLFAWRSL